MHHALASQNPFSQLNNRDAQGPLVPWELKCMREPHQCTAPECDCPPAQPTAPGPSDAIHESPSSTGGHQERPAVRPPEHNRAAGRTDEFVKILRGAIPNPLMWRFEPYAALDETAFMEAIEPPPLFLQEGSR
jgi:hypothetical protein